MKNSQKLVYSKEYTLNSTADASILGLFKSTSRISKSLLQRQQIANNETDMKTFKSTDGMSLYNSIPERDSAMVTKNTFASSAKLILGMERPRNTSEITVRNLTHFYDKLDNDPKTYELLTKLRAEKRMKHLDAIEDYVDWREFHDKDIDKQVSNLIAALKVKLESTKEELNSEFGKKDNILVDFVQRDIDTVVGKYSNIISTRKENILQTYQQIVKINEDSNNATTWELRGLAKKLNDSGFLLHEENAEIIACKTKQKDEYFNSKLDDYNKTFEGINNTDDELITESKENLRLFIERWKNIKLNNYVRILKETLHSAPLVDNENRKIIVKDLKTEQVKITSERIALIQKLTARPLEELSSNLVEKFSKKLEDIYDYAQRTYDKYTELLKTNSDSIYRESMSHVFLFKQNIATISYDFEIDNINPKYNSYQELRSLDELITAEFTPIIQKYSTDRINYSTSIVAYIDDYDEYTNNNCKNIIAFYSSIGQYNDEHKKLTSQNEKNYLIELAKCADNDEDTVFQKEEVLKTIITKMRNSISKDECDECLSDALKVIDELEVEYRDYFSSYEKIIISHEERIRETFHTNEIKVLGLFGYAVGEKLSDIQKKRKNESDFLSKRKEIENAIEEAKQAEANKGSKQKKTNSTNKPLKKGEVPPPLVALREILSYKSLTGFDYLIDFTIHDLVKANLRNIIHGREDDIFNPDFNLMAGIQVDPLETHTSGSKTKRNDKQNMTTENFATITGTNFLQIFNPYEANSTKIFTSPLSLDQTTHLLSEDNYFTEENLIQLYSDLFKSMTEKIRDDHNSLQEISKQNDTERRDEALGELDIRLKSVAPRKGKIEVEEYEKRIDEIEKHIDKLDKQLKLILEQNQKDQLENDKYLGVLKTEFDELNILYEKLHKGIDEDTKLKSVDDKYKKFKASYYDFNTRLQELENKLLDYSKKGPEYLLLLNDNFVKSLLPFEKGGLYSPNEIIHYENKIKELNSETILKDMNARDSLNKTTIADIRTKMTVLMDKMDKKFNSANDIIMAKECIGNKYGAPKRLANEIIISIKMKCNQSQEGLEALFNTMKQNIQEFEKNKNNTTFLKSR
jgi:hypothetical protein